MAALQLDAEELQKAWRAFALAVSLKTSGRRALASSTALSPPGFGFSTAPASKRGNDRDPPVIREGLYSSVPPDSKR